MLLPNKLFPGLRTGERKKKLDRGSERGGEESKGQNSRVLSFFS